MVQVAYCNNKSVAIEAISKDNGLYAKKMFWDTGSEAQSFAKVGGES